MSLASDDPEHVIVVPRRHFTLTAPAGSATTVSGDKQGPRMTSRKLSKLELLKL
jgi:hypothetical protein